LSLYFVSLSPLAPLSLQIDVDWKEGAVDSEGWEYAFDFYSSWYPNEEIVPRGAFVRRRRHLRTMIWDHHPPEEEGGGGGGGEDGEDAGRRKTFNAPGVKVSFRVGERGWRPSSFFSFVIVSIILTLSPLFLSRLPSAS
jgi:hypothetical protein